MVDLSRRKTILGLGMLAVGSGSAFTSAAFNNSVTPSSDMRVVVDEKIQLEPGIMFRNGGTADSTFSPGTLSGPDGETLQEQSGNSLFGGNDGLDNIGIGDVPAAAINDAVNNNLSLEVAVALGVDDKIGNASNGVFQVRNNTSSDQDIAIRFNTFGSDVGSGVTQTQAVQTFRFFDSSDTQISTDDPTTSPQTVDNVVTVSSGTVEQIHVDYNTSTNESALRSASNASSSNPFSSSTDTVDLVNELKVGVEDGNDVSL